MMPGKRYDTPLRRLSNRLRVCAARSMTTRELAAAMGFHHHQMLAQWTRRMPRFWTQLHKLAEVCEADFEDMMVSLCRIEREMAVNLLKKEDGDGK